MKTTQSFGALAAALFLVASHSALAADLVPYRGMVKGEINGSFSSALTSSIAHQGTHVGIGTQETTSIDLGAVVSLVFGNPVPIAGTATTRAANGDALYLDFVLVPTGANPDGSVAYAGSYEITGGTGRFDYAAAGVSGDLGSGVLRGQATLVPTGPDSLSITFRHTFDGTLARPVGR